MEPTTPILSPWPRRNGRLRSCGTILSCSLTSGVTAIDLREGLQQAARDAGHNAVCQGVGPLLQLYFTDGVEEITDYRCAVQHLDFEKFSDFQGALQDRGVYIHPDPLECFYICTAHTDEDIEEAIRAAGEAAKAIA